MFHFTKYSLFLVQLVVWLQGISFHYCEIHLVKGDIPVLGSRKLDCKWAHYFWCKCVMKSGFQCRVLEWHRVGAICVYCILSRLHFHSLSQLCVCACV
jgi:hypothetical protein